MFDSLRHLKRMGKLTAPAWDGVPGQGYAEEEELNEKLQGRRWTEFADPVDMAALADSLVVDLFSVSLDALLIFLPALLLAGIQITEGEESGAYDRTARIVDFPDKLCEALLHHLAESPEMFKAKVVSHFDKHQKLEIVLLLDLFIEVTGDERLASLGVEFLGPAI